MRKQIMVTAFVLGSLMLVGAGCSKTMNNDTMPKDTMAPAKGEMMENKDAMMPQDDMMKDADMKKDNMVATTTMMKK